MMEPKALRPILRNMEVDDLDQVSVIEQEAFHTPWAAMSYVYDINRRTQTHLGVIELPDVASYRQPPMDRLQFLRRRNWVIQGAIVAYGSMWIRNGEGHISHIASHSDFRGKGLGELMLAGLLARAIICRAQFSALEVRVSNVVAQLLYLKYGYYRAAILPKYYTDNHEDAYLMKVPSLDDAYLMKFRANVIALTKKFDFRDQFSGLELELFVKR